MSTSRVSVINRALLTLGQPRVSGVEENPQSRALDELFDASRDAVLAMGGWNFATARKTVPKAGTAPDWGYRSQFELPGTPTHCLRVLQVPDLPRGERWEVEGRRLLCDHDGPLRIRFIFRQENLTSWSPGFVLAMAAHLAAEGSLWITENQNKARAAWDVYQIKLADARRADAAEGVPEALAESPWVAARR